MSLKSILSDVVPCWYELSFLESEPAILLRIHQDFIKYLKVPFNKNAPIIKQFREEFGFGEFLTDFKKDLGFGGVFRRIGLFAHSGEKDSFVEYSVRLPRIKKEDGDCDYCKGSGHDAALDDRCLFCQNGKKWKYEWKPAYQISAGFTALFYLLSTHEIETSSSLPQLFTVQTITRTGTYGGMIDGDISVSLRDWLKAKFDQEGLPEMVKAMRAAYDAMVGIEDYDAHSFRAVVRTGGFFTTDCPGEACGLHPATWHDMEGRGNQFSCHNTDTPVQQITLLAGLAGLHDKARKEMAGLKV